MDTKLLDKAPPFQYQCYFCGSAVPSYNSQFGICQFCELYTDKTQKELMKSKPLSDALSGIQSAIASGDNEGAIKAFDSAFALTQGAGFLFAKAALHLLIADEEFAKRDYATPNGYMEENSVHSKSALSHFSSAKALLFKVISSCDAVLKTNPDPNLLYLKFLCEIRLGRVSSARKSLLVLKSNAKDLPLTPYAEMVYNSFVANKKQEPYLQKGISLGALPSFYYYAAFLSDKNNLGESKRVLLKILKYVQMRQASRLLSGIERVQTIL
ncbi:MAG: hypothetical protein KGH71_01855 [Candidatus Micrarchaeota archaeon]|nr:hypothetical protein [Candidatus Micrarchaeota archaeon]